MLPDLWRMADRRVRPARGALAFRGDLRLDEVLAGILHHERADRVFHDCAAFQDGERWLSRELAALGVPRLSLFGHIAWELCLDGALVRREGEALADAIRDAVLDASRADDGPSAIERAARAHHMARKGDEGAQLPDGFAPRMDRMVREVGRGAWIAGYARGAIVAERIEGIRSRLGLAPAEPAQRATLGALLDGAIDGAGAAVDEVLGLRV